MHSNKFTSLTEKYTGLIIEHKFCDSFVPIPSFFTFVIILSSDNNGQLSVGCSFCTVMAVCYFIIHTILDKDSNLRSLTSNKQLVITKTKVFSSE